MLVDNHEAGKLSRPTNHPPSHTVAGAHREKAQVAAGQQTRRKMIIDCDAIAIREAWLRALRFIQWFVDY